MLRHLPYQACSTLACASGTAIRASNRLGRRVAGEPLQGLRRFGADGSHERCSNNILQKYEELNGATPFMVNA